MTAGIFNDYYTEYDKQIWIYVAGFATTINEKNIGNIIPQNIGTFKITDIVIEEITTANEDESDEQTEYFFGIKTNHKCLISFNGKTYRVDSKEDNFYYYSSYDNNNIYFADGEKVEITYELL